MTGGAGDPEGLDAGACLLGLPAGVRSALVELEVAASEMTHEQAEAAVEMLLVVARDVIPQGLPSEQSKYHLSSTKILTALGHLLVAAQRNRQET